MVGDVFSAIYALRREFDLSRPSRLRESLSELHAAVLNLRPSGGHPYLLDDEAHRKLQATAGYHQTCCGLPGAPIPEGGYFYRVTALGALRDHTLNLRAGYIDFRQASVEDAYIQLRKWHSGAGWLPLRELFTGQVSGPRGFSWWTTLELPGPILDCSCHRMGLPNIWIPPSALVLRCPIAFVRRSALAYVPSTVDGFFSGFFQPTSEEESPVCGRTIDLEDSAQLQPGVDEYVLRPVDIEGANIECLPVPERIPVSHKVERDEISTALKAYLESQFSQRKAE